MIGRISFQRPYLNQLCILYLKQDDLVFFKINVIKIRSWFQLLSAKNMEIVLFPTWFSSLGAGALSYPGLRTIQTLADCVQLDSGIQIAPPSDNDEFNQNLRKE